MRRSGSIFVVDDSRDDVTLISYAFLMAGIRNPIRWIKDEHTLMERLGCASVSGEAGDEMPLLVVIDGKMPDCDAFEMIKWIRTQPKCLNLLVVLLTGSKDPDQKKKAYEAGANWHVTKTADFGELTDLVRRVHEFWSSPEDSKISSGPD